MAATETRGWAFLQAGDLKTAEREFSTASGSAGLYPAETSLGYVELARKDEGGRFHFDRALNASRRVSALLGRGEALTI